MLASCIAVIPLPPECHSAETEVLTVALVRRGKGRSFVEKPLLPRYQTICHWCFATTGHRDLKPSYQSLPCQEKVLLL